MGIYNESRRSSISRRTTRIWTDTSSQLTRSKPRTESRGLSTCRQTITTIIRHPSIRSHIFLPILSFVFPMPQTNFTGKLTKSNNRNRGGHRHFLLDHTNQIDGSVDRTRFTAFIACVVVRSAVNCGKWDQIPSDNTVPCTFPAIYVADGDIAPNLVDPQSECIPETNWRTRTRCPSIADGI